MGGTRALLASLGASVSLVAGAALSLLAASFIFAYDGIVGTVDAAPGRTSLRVASPSSPERSATASATPTLLVERPQRATAKNPAPTRRVRAAAGGSAKRTPAPTSSGVRKLSPPVAAPAPPAPQPATPAPAKAAEPKAGDGVRKLGNDVGDAVHDTGNALGGVVQPLSPPVSQAIEKVLDVIATVVQNAVDGLAGALDTTLQK